MYVKKFATYVGVFAVLSIGSAQATVLVPGGDVPLVGAPYVLADHALVAGTDISVDFDAGSVHGTLYLEVRHGTAGGLDFLYQLSNDVGASAIHRFTNLSFAGWDTDVVYATNLSGTVAPSFADRSDSPGSVVGFDFEDPGTTLGAGALSRWVVIQTNAPAYTTLGSTSVINGGAVSVGSFAPVPEPATMALAGLALGAAVRRRARKR